MICIAIQLPTQRCIRAGIKYASESVEIELTTDDTRNNGFLSLSFIPQSIPNHDIATNESIQNRKIQPLPNCARAGHQLTHRSSSGIHRHTRRRTASKSKITSQLYRIHTLNTIFVWGNGVLTLKQLLAAASAK
jgi:hypothetical protein